MAEPVLQSLPLEGLQSGDNRAVIGVTILTIAGRCCVRGKPRWRRPSCAPVAMLGVRVTDAHGVRAA